MTMLDRSITLAVQAHMDQVDKAGEAYILHPLRVMTNPLLKSEPERCCAVLHDVLEDTAVTEDDLRRAGIADRVIKALDGVTRRDGEDYMVFVERVCQDPISRAVKAADLMDNMDMSRLPAPTDRDWARHAKYEQAFERLMASIDGDME